MVNCKATLQQLDLSHFNLEEVDEATKDHFENCVTCRQAAQSYQQFDQSLSSALQDVPVPPSLEAQLLALVNSEQAIEDTIATPKLPSSPVPRWRWQSFTVLTASVMIGLILWFSQPPANTPLDLANQTVKQKLQQFERLIDSGTAALVHPSQTVVKIEPQFLNLKSSDLFGEDLDDDGEQDVAGFRFKHRGAAGVILALPASKYLNTPDNTVPSPGSKRVYQWTSADRSTVYICHIETGSSHPLFDSLFGLT